MRMRQSDGWWFAPEQKPLKNIGRYLFQLDNVRLPGGEEFCPARIECCKRTVRLILRQTFTFRLRGAPRGLDQLRQVPHAANLLDDGGLDLSRRNSRHRAFARSVLQNCLADMVAVEQIALARVGWRKGQRRQGR
jgi:hypothetical protein